MDPLFIRLKQRKLVQWALAYIAGAWVVLQVLDLAADSYLWPRTVMHIAFGVLALGFVVVLVLAWYHGERGAQRLSGCELLILAVLLVIGGGLLWRFGGSGTAASSGAKSAIAQRADVAPPATAGNQRDATKVAATSATTSAANVAISSALPNPPIPAKSVAVLPFESLSTDKANAFFADGMQDLILTKLADIGDLKVIARTSTMQYGSHPQNLTLVGQQLGVATILEGSVQKAGKQVLINVQLIDVKTDSHIWAESYTRTLDNIFGVEGEVAQKVATALNAKLTAQETAAVNRVLTTNPQAYVLYLKAQHGISLRYISFSNNQSALSARLLADKQKAADELRQAIALDPNFAAAYADLAWLEGRLPVRNKQGHFVPNRKLGMTYARKALSLQPDSPMALVAIGTAQFFSGKVDAGLQALRKAARLAPSNHVVALSLTNAYRSMGDWRQADTVAHQAVRLDPRNVANYVNAALTSRTLGHYADARQMLERGLAISPDDAELRVFLGDVLVLLGDFAGARAQYAQLPAGQGYGKFEALAGAWRLSRNCTEAIKAARQMPSPPPDVADTGLREELIGRCELTLGNQAGGRATLTQARAAIQAVLQKPTHISDELGVRPILQSHLAFTEAWLGQRDAAMRTIDAAIASRTRGYTDFRKQSGMPHTPEGARLAARGFYKDKAAILARFGDAKGATDILRLLFQTPGSGQVASPALLKLDSLWDPIRHDPAFQALLMKYAHAEPAVTGSDAGHG